MLSMAISGQRQLGQSTPSCQRDAKKLVVIIIICDEDDAGLFENTNDWLFEITLEYLKTSTIVIC